MPKPYVQVTLRLPLDLHAWLMVEAQKHTERGISTWIVRALEERKQASS